MPRILIIIGLCLLLLSPEVEWGVGLSGLLYALFACAAIRMAMSGEYLSYAVVAFLIVKIVLEQTIGPSAAMEHFVGSSILVDAHMFGVIAGLLFGVFFRESDGSVKWLTRSTSGLVQPLVDCPYLSLMLPSRLPFYSQEVLSANHPYL